MRRHKRPLFRILIPLTGFAVLTLACNLVAQPVPTATAPAVSTRTSAPVLPSPTTTAIPTAVPPFRDVTPLLSGLCYNFLQTLHDQTLVLDSMSDLSALYDQADKSKLCPDAANRHSFDFTDGQIVGTVATAQGCRLDLKYDHVEIDDAARQRTLVFHMTVDGNCGYGLVRPLWLAIDRPPPGYTTRIRLAAAS